MLLGAGFSKRFGSDKRLHTLHGQTVAECTVELYSQVFQQLRVVIRPDDEALSDRLKRFPVELITAQDAHLGMGHSLAAGFHDLPWRWAFVGLLDMPFVQVATLRQLYTAAVAAKHTGIIRPQFTPASGEKPTFGHPIGWHHRYFAEIRQASGDAGARALLIKYAGKIHPFDSGDAGICQDIDTPQDIHNPSVVNIRCR